MNRKGSTSVIILIVVVVILFAVGVWYWNKTSTAPPTIVANIPCNSTNAENDFHGEIMAAINNASLNSPSTTLFWFGNAPSGSIDFAIYHADDVSGPWSKIGTYQWDDNVRLPWIATVSSTDQNNYYRIEALSGSGTILKSFSPFCIPPYQDQ